MSCRALQILDWKLKCLRCPSSCLSRVRSLSALDSEIDLHPLLVLLQDAVIFAERMAFPAVRQKNALHIRMAIELDPEHVEHFTFQPVRGGPDRNAGGNRRAICYLSFYAQALVTGKRIEHPNEVELPFAFWIMHSGDIYAIIELLLVA